MLTALLTDIHANREALTACLDHADRAGAERYIFLGDYVGYNADPGWVVDRVMSYVERGAIALLGNHDAASLANKADMHETARQAIEWTRGQLNDAQREFLAGLPLRFEQDGRLYVHANAEAPDEWHYVTSTASAARSFQATECRQIFCGHVHVPALYHLSPTGKIGEFMPVDGVDLPLLPRRRWLALIGSVGQPRDHDPSACYALLDPDKDILRYVRVPYDSASAARKVREAGLPHVLSLRLERGF